MIVGGFVARRSDAPMPLPTGAQLLRSGPTTLWSLPRGPLLPPRCAWNSDTTVWAVGLCGATDDALAQCARTGVQPGDVCRWPGAYALVQTDGPDRSVILHADLAEAVPLYWAATGDGWAWSTSSRILADLLGTGPDPAWLAVRLLAPGRTAPLGDRSAFADVHRIPAGHRITLTAHGPGTRTRSARTDIGIEEAAERLGTALRSAVALRLDTAVTTCDVSGGLDSTSLTRLAAEHAFTHGRSIAAITRRPAGVRHGGDLDYIADAVDHRGLVHAFVDHDDTTRPYSHWGAPALAALPTTDEPAPSLPTHAALTRDLALVRDRFGATAHMTGDGGDTLLCPSLIHLADLARTRSWRRLYADACGWARVRRTAPIPLLRAAVAATRHDPADDLTHAAAVLRETAAPRAFAIHPVPAPPPWATPHARNEAARACLDAAARTPAPADLGNAAAADQLAEIGRTAAADAAFMHALTGVALHNPFVDSRVIAVVLATASAARTRPDRFKPLLAVALGPLLPPRIAARTTKGEGTSDHIAGLRAHHDHVLALADGHLAAAGLVDPEALTTAITAMAAGLPAPSDLDLALTAEAWLRAVHEAPRQAWTHHLAAETTP
ncbi:albusnodin/ikarugamycin family macrolactam cyclase [Yinghuangia aomiensis]